MISFPGFGFHWLDVYQALFPWSHRPQDPSSSGSISLGSTRFGLPQPTAPPSLGFLVHCCGETPASWDLDICVSPSWVSTRNPHLGHSLDVFSGGTKAVNAISDILLCMLLQGVLEFLFLLAFLTLFLLTRSSLSRSSKTWIVFGNIVPRPAASLFLKSLSLFLSLAIYFS